MLIPRGIPKLLGQNLSFGQTFLAAQFFLFIDIFDMLVQV